MSEECNNSLLDNKEVRCSCGQLIAIQTNAGLEIKCKRCKQVQLIPLEDIQIQ